MSDSDHDDLDLEALKSIFGSKAFDDLPSPKEKTKKTSSKKTNKSGSKKNQKQKKPVINLDELLDGVNLDSMPNDDNDIDGLDFSIPQKKDNTKNQSMKNYGTSIFDFQTNTDVFASFERKIESYLDSSIHTLQNDVIKEIEQLLIDTDDFDDIIVDFLETLNHSIYEIIMLGKSEVTENQSAFYSIFDNFSNSFFETFRKISDFSSRSTVKSTNIIRSCRSLVEAKKPIFERQMKNSAHDISQELKELNKARTQNSSLVNENTKKIRSCFHRHTLLEGQLRALDELNEYTIKRIQQFQESTSQSFSISNKRFPEDDYVLRCFKKASNYFKNNYMKKKVNDINSIKANINKAIFASEDLLTTINQVEFALNMISNSFSESQIVQPIFKPNETNTKISIKSKVIEESKNGLMEAKTQREDQFQEVENVFNKYNKRNKTQIDE